MVMRSAFRKLILPFARVLTACAGISAVPLVSCQGESSHAEPQREFKAAVKKLKHEYDRGYRDFSIELIDVSGKWMDGIPESETRLRVNGGGDVTLFRRKGPGNSNVYPPGSYTGSVPDTSMKQFLKVLAVSNFRSLPRAFPGPWEPLAKMVFTIGKESYSFSWGFSREPMPESMVKATMILDDWTQNACPKAIWSLRMSAENVKYQGGRLTTRLKVENLGDSSIHIAHPGSPGFGTDFGILLDYGEKQLIKEGYTPNPIESKFAPLETEALKEVRLIEITRNSPYVVDFAADLNGEAPRGWLGLFSFKHHLPSDTLSEKAVFNGALFTDELEW